MTVIQQNATHARIIIELLHPFLLKAKETITLTINKDRVQVNATKVVKLIKLKLIKQF